MQNDRQIKISAAGSRKATSWPVQQQWWSEFIQKLKTPVRGEESLAQYLSLPKGRQDEQKDVGGFVGGVIKGQRKAANVESRDLITLDLDSIPSGATNDILKRIDSLGCGYAVYSTRKHEAVKPRLRFIAPLDRSISVDEYEPIARKIAAIIGMELCDPTTFQASRLMYWPSCCSDGEYIFIQGDKPILSADGILAMYSSWKDVTLWPQVPGAAQSPQRLAQKQGDPKEKQGVVGAFCKTYDVRRAMSELIAGEYEICDIEGRYTYAGGSTAGGAVVYENGNFLYSHHATDPAGGKLCNSFDLVRLHKFGELDENAKMDTPTNKLPSYAAMCRFAVNDQAVSSLLNIQRYEKATEDFAALAGDDANWISKLAVAPSSGIPEKTTDNILLILESDPLLKGKVAYDEFAGKGIVLGALPWDESSSERTWSDNDDAGAQWYLEKVYQITGKDKIMNAISLCARKNSFDRLKDYLASLSWDGIRRLDTLFIDYLGAEDNIYTRAVTRKSFTAGIARAMDPGCKFDNMTILTGAQGKGKSTLLGKMGKCWFSDSIKTFEGKEAAELVQGVWIVEIGELEAFNKSETGRIKQFLSQREDIYRAAYGRHVKWHPRRCVFFGTSNNGEYLRDATGNRRFWPLDIGILEPRKDVWKDLGGEVDQIWAEALLRWQVGEPLHLSGDVEKFAMQEQEDHREHSMKEGIVIDFIQKRVPPDWQKWDLDKRRLFWAGGMALLGALIERDRICALEVWCEAFSGDMKHMKYADAAEINNAIRREGSWERPRHSIRFGCYGVQKGFKKM